jgi:hypothetical protein
MSLRGVVGVSVMGMGVTVAMVVACDSPCMTTSGIPCGDASCVGMKEVCCDLGTTAACIAPDAQCAVTLTVPCASAADCPLGDLCFSEWSPIGVQVACYPKDDPPMTPKGPPTQLCRSSCECLSGSCAGFSDAGIGFCQ